MQSKRWYSCALPKFFERLNQYSSNGCRSAGQAFEHSVQRMQGCSGGAGGNSFGDAQIRQLLPLTMGTSSRGSAKPIIGPPSRVRSVSARGRASGSRSSTGVPISTSQLPALSTLPVSVTMRLISGSPCANARYTACAVPTLKHCTP